MIKFPNFTFWSSISLSIYYVLLCRADWYSSCGTYIKRNIRITRYVPLNKAIINNDHSQQANKSANHHHSFTFSPLFKTSKFKPTGFLLLSPFLSAKSSHREPLNSSSSSSWSSLVQQLQNTLFQHTHSLSSSSCPHAFSPHMLMSLLFSSKTLSSSSS